MQDELRSEFANAVLSRVLDFFEAEICEASDEEVLAAAAELRMNPRMKGSIAFAGITFPAYLDRHFVHGLNAEQVAALQRRWGSLGGSDGWPDYDNLAEWVALIRQLRAK